MSHDQDDSELLYKTHCPDCGSDDNLAVYDDGHGFCFSPGCGHKKTVDGVSQPDAEPNPSKPTEHSIDIEYINFSKRKLDVSTCRKFDFGITHNEAGKAIQVAGYRDQNGRLAQRKFRDETKNMWVKPVVDGAEKLKDCQMFGQHVWGERYDRKVIVCTGEHDPMSIAEATKFKIPAVSVSSGDQSAVKCLKANYRWLDRFDEIILWFDNDESGQSVVAEAASLFQVGKVKTIVVEGIKDASDLKQAGRPGDIAAAIWSATTYSPSGIVNAADLIEDMERPPVVQIADYPFPGINDMLRGMNEHEIVYHVSGTGVGKTTIITEIQYSLWEQGIKFGVMRFEDDRVKAQTDLMSAHIGKRIHLEKDFPISEKKTLHTKIFGGRQVELFDPETAEWGFDALLGYIRFMHKAQGCRVIFIDPLSFIVAQLPNSADERKAIDKVSMELAQITKRMPVNLQITHHLSRPSGDLSHEDGAIISLKHVRGSGGLAMFANGLIGWERNQQGERPDLTRARVLKNRMVGPTGLAGVIKFDMETGRNLPTHDEYTEPNSKDKPSPFTPADEDSEY